MCKIAWQREMVTLLEAVSADGYVFPTFLVTKGKVHTFGIFGNVKDEDAEVRLAKSPKDWADDELGCHWLTDIIPTVCGGYSPGRNDCSFWVAIPHMSTYGSVDLRSSRYYCVLSPHIFHNA